MEENKKPDKKENEEKKSLTAAQIVTISMAAAAIFTVAAFFVFQMQNGNAPGKSAPIGAPKVASTADNSALAGATESQASSSTVDESVATDTAPPATVAATAEKKADLYVVKYSFNHDPKSAEEFTVSIKIGNKGTASAGAFHWEWWPTSSGKACGEKVDGLAVGDTMTVECNYTYGGWANYATKAVVDSKDEVDELNESNNVATKQVVPIHDEAKPDLYISSYFFDHPPVQGELFTINIGIFNRGDANTGSFWWEWWPTAFGKACRAKIDSLAAHGGRVVHCNFTYGGWANYATKAVADADDDVAESNETNNVYAQTVMPIH